MAKYQRPIISNVNWRYKALELSHITGGRINLSTPWENTFALSTKDVNPHLSYDSNSICRHIPKISECTHLPKDNTRMSVGSLFVLPKSHKQSRCPLTWKTISCGTTTYKWTKTELLIYREAHRRPNPKISHWKEARHKGVHNMLFHLYEVQE